MYVVVIIGFTIGVKLDDVKPAGLDDHELVTVVVPVTSISSIPILDKP